MVVRDRGTRMVVRDRGHDDGGGVMNGQPASWARNVVFGAKELRAPSSVAELQEIVRGSDRVRALGSGHSFNRIADTTGVLVTTSRLPPVLEITPGRSTVRVAAGVRYGELAQHLYGAGFALRNLGSLPHISVAGACATGTHGSGDANQSLAASVTALEMVTADGELTRLERGSADFAGAVTALGGLGIVTTMELEIIPSFEVRQFVYEDIPAAAVAGQFEEIFSSGYSVSVFTDWRGGSGNRVWQKQRVDVPGAAGSGPVGSTAGSGPVGSAAGSGVAGGGQASWLGGRLADGPHNPVPGMAPENATEQMGVPGPWHERLPHFRLAFTPSSGEELQSEYLVPREFGAAAVEALARIGDRVAPVLQIAEIRTIAADDLWMSMAFERDTVGFHFTWIQDDAAVTPVLSAIEEALAPFAARPHWGKVFTTPAETVRALYPRWADFAALLRHFDPAGKFRNEFMNRYFPLAP
jgi:alditol oxidase